MSYGWVGIRSGFLFERDLFGKPVSTFPDHALATIAPHAVSGAAPVYARHFAPAAGCKARRPRSASRIVRCG